MPLLKRGSKRQVTRLYVVAIIIYIIVAIKNRASGVEMSMLYKELPPD